MRSPMRSPILPVILLSSASLIIAEEPAKEFWWSYAPENYTETARYGYDASFEVCGSSCSECREDAKQCWAEDYSNICYEPAYGETCCQDVYGTACVEGYYCAYNNTGVAYCCADGTNVNDCGALFDDKLSSTQREAPTTVVVTQFREPTHTATAASQVDETTVRQKHTMTPKVLGVTSMNDKGSDGLSTGAKVGISVGAFGAVAAIAFGVAFLMIRRRRNTKYNQIGEPYAAQQQHQQQFRPAVPTSYPTPAPIQLGHAPHGVGVYEPMRGSEHLTESESQELKQPYTVSPQPSVAMPYYHDNPTHGTELHEIPELNQRRG